jgi:hypothetical protein
MQGKEYLIRNSEDEKAVLRKQKRIEKQTGKKPRIVLSFRNSIGSDEFGE